MAVKEAFPGYSPSPLESAFDTEISHRFVAPLGDPFVDRHGRAVRLSHPVSLRNHVIAFQYTRDNLLRDAEQATRVLLPLNPGLVEKLGPKPEMVGHENPKYLNRFEEVMEYEGNIVSLLAGQVEKRDGKHDPNKALTDPSYYTEGTPVSQWPESFKFVLIDARTAALDLTRPAEIGPKGRYQYNDARADIYGRLDIPANFVDLRTGIAHGELTLGVTYPRLERATTRAYIEAFTDSKPKDYQTDGMDVDDYSHFPHNPRTDISLFVMTDHSDAKEVMNRVGTFVHKLTVPA